MRPSCNVPCAVSVDQSCNVWVVESLRVVAAPLLCCLQGVCCSDVTRLIRGSTHGTLIAFGAHLDGRSFSLSTHSDFQVFA